MKLHMEANGKSDEEKKPLRNCIASEMPPQHFSAYFVYPTQNHNGIRAGPSVQLYKNLLHLGRDYPKGYDYFRSRLKAAFLKNRDVKDPEQLTMLLARGQYIIKELEALYMLKKYRTLKKRYYTDTP
ncbi:electron transfer flavoprotein regulatory factor 1 [Rhipicephalus sanguineus]|uniref:electron transfer flavoprotein regulatory factor 1 n=1 Tax=Rhipicephalus sanguineus TaxID=34632 RepID=UPI0020C1F60D|nr:electron transfer flavoprotein regulatory factor 1 [Rhipicephalus sanguineus]